MVDYSPLFAILGHQFKQPNLLKQALTHASIKKGHAALNYERLEFLGDRVLSLVIAHLLFERFPKDREGELARRHTFLVRQERLVEVARTIGLASYILMAKNEAKVNERNNASILADACEAVIAALYLDGGFDIAANFIRKNWEHFLDSPLTGLKDAKSTLQEWAQSLGLEPPVYKLGSKSGSDHNPRFVMEVYIQGYPPHGGQGSTKREASQTAAQNFLNLLKEQSNE